MAGKQSRKGHAPETPIPRGNEPYTPDAGERESALPPGFQSTTDPAIRMADQPESVDQGLSANNPDVAWELDDPERRGPGAEADRLGAGFDPTRVSDETGDASSPRPDANVSGEIGEEAGVPVQENEELEGSSEKLAQRDAHRWELNPASSEDYPERAREESPRRQEGGEPLPPA
ncbi:MAG TPA: DUF6335 family protein [Candidatus Eisenbacteria bacterium]|nr:DUF6335 family protein [Candidatus Eisenbacteria bacterium]